MSNMTRTELVALVKSVFEPKSNEKGLAIITDVPRAGQSDKEQWRARRVMAAQWAEYLREAEPELGFPVHFFAYPDVGLGNADLPAQLCLLDTTPPDLAESLPSHSMVDTQEVFQNHSMFMAPTQYSTTAPLKMAGSKYGFRGVTMPGFNSEMLPALKLDYTLIGRRVAILADLLNRATSARLVTQVGGQEHTLIMDLRHRKAHASGGLQRNPAEVGNLPSGEAYITPYEGEHPHDHSATQGTLPVQFDDGLVLYRIENNSAVQVLGDSPAALREARAIIDEPAYANIAELGLGVLSDFGVRPIGEILLDEKLGLHVAFGRSDHFGGIMSPARFSSPSAVVHIDRVYLPSTQPMVKIVSLDLSLDGETLPLMRGYDYVLDSTRWGW